MTRAERQTDAHVRVVPNESMFVHEGFAKSLGELVQELLDAGAEHGVTVEIDSRDRTRPGEQRSGASPLAGIAIFLLGLTGREAALFADRIFDATVDWVLRHRHRSDEPVPITMYGPDGAPLRTIYVDVDAKLRDHPD